MTDVQDASPKQHDKPRAPSLRLAISNIAWLPEEADAIYPILAEAGVRGLEIAPRLAFAASVDPFRPTAAELAEFKQKLVTFNLELVSMQSLLFGTVGANLFGDETERRLFETGIASAIELAEVVGIPNLVVGSPTARVIPPDMPRKVAEAIARDSFGRLGDRAKAAGAKLALEPNPRAYGTNFLNTMAETIEFAVFVDHPAVAVNFDIGALHMNGEWPEAVALYDRGAHCISHVHISEPNLAPAPSDAAALAVLVGQLNQRGYAGWFSIEMRAVGEKNLANVCSCVEASTREIARVVGEGGA